MTQTLRGHMRPVFALAVSGDGKRLCSATQETTIKVWDVEAGKEICTLGGHLRPVMSLALSRDGKQLYSGGADQTVKLWNIAK